MPITHGIHIVEMTPVVRTNRRYVFVVALAALGIALSIRAFAAVRELEHDHLKREFESKASDRLAALQAGMDLRVDAPHSVRSLFVASETVTRQEFGLFVRELAEDPGIEALEWIPRVTEALEKLVVLASADWATLRLPKKGEPGLHLVAAAGPAVVEFPPIPMFTEAMTLSTAAFTEGRITECCRQKIHLVRSVEDQTFSQAECFLGRGHPNQEASRLH